jgi:hypothetical protein
MELGTTSPSAFAVSMLIASSNVVGCMTGRSAAGPPAMPQPILRTRWPSRNPEIRSAPSCRAAAHARRQSATPLPAPSSVMNSRRFDIWSIGLPT